MKNTKHLLLTFLLWAGIVSILQAQNMFVLETNNTQASFNISEVRSLTFSTGNIHVNETAGNVTTYDLSDVRYINFNDLVSHIVHSHHLNHNYISVYPNPAIDIVAIGFNNTENEALTVIIYDMHGREVYREFFAENDDVKIDMSSFSKGLYLCRIQNENINTVKKIIKN